MLDESSVDDLKLWWSGKREAEIYVGTSDPKLPHPEGEKQKIIRNFSAASDIGTVIEQTDRMIEAGNSHI